MEWQPIETAPRNGTRVMLWHPRWVDGPDFGQFDKEPFDEPGCYACWYTPIDGSNFEPQPTHWAPMPKPPIGKAG